MAQGQLVLVMTSPHYIFFQFAGNAGGYLGIFLGASILTLTEWIEFFALALYVLIKRSCVGQNATS